jgi:hypothetical protein
MNQVGPAQQQVVPQTIMSADGQYQILALPTFQMGNGDWQNHVLSLAQAQTILSIPGLGPVQAVDPATLAAAEAAGEAVRHLQHSQMPLHHPYSVSTASMRGCPCMHLFLLRAGMPA